MKRSKSDIERKSLSVGKWGNLLMGVTGVAAAYLSHSDALLVDGLYSGVNFVAAIVAARISVSAAKPADRRYPFGYDAHEALYVTFRSLVLLGIILFAATSAIGKIVSYAAGGTVPELVFMPIFFYAVVMVAVCLALALWHRHNWRLSGRQSELLRTEIRAAVVDAAISGGVGGGLLAAGLLRATPLAVVVPVADAVIVLILCAVIIRQPASMFLGALREVAGAAADPETMEMVTRRLNEILEDRPFSLLTASATKLGRTHMVVAYIKPESPVAGKAVDALWEAMQTRLQEEVGPVKSEIVITETPPYA